MYVLEDHEWYDEGIGSVESYDHNDAVEIRLISEDWDYLRGTVILSKDDVIALAGVFGLGVYAKDQEAK